MAKVFTGHLKSVSFSDHATPWLSIRNSAQNLVFESSRSDQTRIIVFIFLQIFLSALHISTHLLGMLNYFSSVSVGAFVWTMFTPVILGWIIIGMRAWKRFRMNSFSPTSTLLLLRIESLYAVGTCVSSVLSIVANLEVGHCAPGVDSNDFSAWGCTVDPKHQMPESAMMASLFLPLLLTVIVKGATWSSISLGFLIIVVSNIAFMIHYDLMCSMPAFLTFVPLCLVVLYEQQRQSISLFLLSQNQEHLLRENERLAEETHANELRHMIGNVAHDLKTVSWFLVCAADC
jgi:uncharacterized protein YceK